MSILGFSGFGTENLARERLTSLGGAVGFETDIADLPAGTSAEVAIGGANINVRVPWFDDPNAGRFEAPDTGYWFGALVRRSNNSGNNSSWFFGVSRNGGSIILGVSSENATQRPTIVINGVVVATAAVATYTTNTGDIYDRVIVEVESISAGSDIHVYLAGNIATPVVSYTLTAPDVATIQGMGLPNEHLARQPATVALDRWTSFWVMDPNDGTGITDINRLISGAVRRQVFTGNGPNQDWTGDYTDIDEIPFNDGDDINTGAVDQISDFTKDALSGTVDAMAAVQVKSRVIRTDATAGTQIGTRIDDGTVVEQVAAAPGSGDVWALFQTAPDGTAWSPSNYDGTAIGFASRT